MAYSWTSFTLTIAVKNNLATLYNAWTQQAAIEKWFLKSCKFYNDQNMQLGAEQNIEAGCHYQWTWFLYDEVEKGNISQANGIDFLQFSFAGNCLVDVQLKEIDQHIMVTLTQHNIPTDEQSKFRIRMGCLEGWTFYLTNLKCYFETGHDLRNKIAVLKGINN